MRMPSVSPRHAFYRCAAVLLLFWLVALLAGPALLNALDLSFNPHGHTRLHPHGHPFVDARTLLGLPNAMDVLSNLPLSLAGLWGMLVFRGRLLPGTTRQAARVFFAGLLLTGLGSAWYHWAPDAAGLVWDRLGMAVTFSGALALAVAERVGQVPARQTLRVLLPLALLSAILPASSGNVLPWAVVQFGGMALIVWLALRKSVVGAIGIRLGVLMGLYGLAKWLEFGDEAVFHATADTVSGHSLKHCAAACAAWPVIAALAPQRRVRAPASLRQNAPRRAA